MTTSSSSSVSASAPSSTPCATWIKKRDACRSKRGEKSERCCQAAFRAKRCLSFIHCPEEAAPFYGETNGGMKYWCAAFFESDCFGNPRLMAIDSSKETSDRKRLFDFHQKAKRRVGGNRQQFRDCKDFADRLQRCLQKNGVEL